MRRHQNRNEPEPQGAGGERRTDGPLDGSVSGTIGGGGPESGGPAPRRPAPDTPPFKPENAASGRREPDPIGAGVERERLQPVPTAADREPRPSGARKRPR
jgi:hypothetical protein